MGKYRIITIERQYASGGKQIASQLAEKLGYSFYIEEFAYQQTKPKRY